MNKLVEQWRSCGLEDGDIALIHSSAKRTLKTHGITPAELLQSFQDAVGYRGTVLFPVFNFGWCRGEPFNVLTTKSETGILSETARMWPGSQTTSHPAYRVAVIGALARAMSDYFTSRVNCDAYGYGSPFHMLHLLGGKIGILDLPDQNAMTFYHYVEESIMTPQFRSDLVYRFHKTFPGTYIDATQNAHKAEFNIFVRKDGVETWVDPMGELLWERGLYRGDRPHVGSGFRTIKATDVFNATAEIITSGKAEGMLWRKEFKPAVGDAGNASRVGASL